MRPRPDKPRAVEFFAGIGLVRLALENQGWKVVLANDFDASKAEIYRQNWSDDLIQGDIRDLAAEQIPDCELFTASFPCNDLSIAGRWEGLNGAKSSAFWRVIELLDEMGSRKPPLVLLENVVGFLLRRNGADLAEALSALSQRGYCVDALLLNAKHWVPQSRARLFIVAKELRDRPNAAARRDPPPSHTRPEALVRFIRSHPELPWDLQPLPDPPDGALALKDILEDLPDSSDEWWSEDRAGYFMQQLSDRHLEEANRMIAGRSISYATAFRRMRNKKSMAELRTDGIAGCLRTPRGGSARQILFKAGKNRYQVRLLTARECARLQGVRDDYGFRADVPLNRALFGFGDAVCVPVIEWIAEHYLNPIARDYGLRDASAAHA
ncbi:MAG: DNA (cytosine-5-)-methyltransferase [Pirellulales bacterium]